MKELVVLLGGCPRVTRQPYSTYLFMERCMFGRQMEKEEIIGFCLKQSCHQVLDVLPIIGPHGVGKWTLVEHVCLDERVRERFAKIHRLSSDQLDHLESLLVDDTARSLMVIDMVDGGDANGEEPWRRFHAAVRRRAHGGSKIIVISRTEVHSRSLGTVPPLRLLPPRREELWYFFRALAFGAADPDDRPDLARVAIALCDFAMGLCDFALYAAANTIAASLRADLSAHAWRRVHKVYAEATSLQLGAARERFEAGHYYLCRPVKGAPGAPCLFSNRRKLIGVARSELPLVTMLDLLAGGYVPPAGAARFDVLVWQSPIPPYGSYVATCDMERAGQLVAREKRARKLRKKIGYPYRLST
ncbi:hypothetical protein EJB05_47022, partial [Eragrostis curvula]